MFTKRQGKNVKEMALHTWQVTMISTANIVFRLHMMGRQECQIDNKQLETLNPLILTFHVSCGSVCV